MSKFGAFFDGLRRVVVFLLGVLIVLDGLLDDSANVIPELVIGMVMVGILPVENILDSLPRRRRRRDSAIDNG